MNSITSHENYRSLAQINVSPWPCLIVTRSSFEFTLYKAHFFNTRFVILREVCRRPTSRRRALHSILGVFRTTLYSFLFSRLNSRGEHPNPGREELLPVVVYHRIVAMLHFGVQLNSLASSPVLAPASHFKMLKIIKNLITWPQTPHKILSI